MDLGSDQNEGLAVGASPNEAKPQSADPPQRGEAGGDVVAEPRTRRKILDSISSAGAAKATGGATAARSQDFLYGDDGLPR